MTKFNQEMYMTTSVKHPKQFEFTTATDLLSLYSMQQNVILHNYKDQYGGSVTHDLEN